MKHKEVLERATGARPAVVKQQGPEGKGSAWNVNNFQWEEKQVGKWSRDTMQGILSKFE